VPLHSVAIALALVAVMLGATSARGAGEFGQADTQSFVQEHCASCHGGEDAEAKLDLEALAFAPADASNFQTWVKVHDRLQAGEMPPKDRKRRPSPAELDTFLGGLASSLSAKERESTTRYGRAPRRRLNRYEYENALRDLFAAPWLQVKEQLPEDGETHRFNKSGAGLDVSHVHLSRYMAAADYAMRQMLSLQLARPQTTTKRYYARDESSLTKFWPSVFTPVPDRLTFPVLGMRASRPCAPRRRRSRWARRTPRRARRKRSAGRTGTT
jgi:mono/diheme cytochrome c family protein